MVVQTNSTSASVLWKNRQRQYPGIKLLCVRIIPAFETEVLIIRVEVYWYVVDLYPDIVVVEVVVYLPPEIGGG